MFYTFYLFSFLLNLNAALTPWHKVELVEAPAHKCLPLEADGSRLLCASESVTLDGAFTHFSEVRFQAGKTEKRSVFELRDTTTVCKGSLQSVSRFYGFETKDLDHDGRSDATVLIRAGKLKRRGFQDGVCNPEKIGTAIYEVSFRNGVNGLESYEPSYSVIKRLQSMAAVPGR